jgi:hypothetical protein
MIFLPKGLFSQTMKILSLDVTAKSEATLCRPISHNMFFVSVNTHLIAQEFDKKAEFLCENHFKNRNIEPL